MRARRPLSRPPTPVALENGAVRIPVASVSDGNLHRFEFDDDGVERALHRDREGRITRWRRLSTPARSAARRAIIKRVPK